MISNALSYVDATAIHIFSRLSAFHSNGSAACTMSTAAASDLENFACNGRKILGAALNYLEVVKERNLAVPNEPLFFLKPTSSYIKEGEQIVIPRVFTKVAHEIELGVIIGKKCKNVSEENALDYVGGYCLGLDLTAQCALAVAREKGHPWTFGKGFDTSTPVSRFISTAEVPDPHNLSIWLKINGEMRQQANTSDLIFKVPALIAYASRFMTLEPNDLILTGTPSGALPMKAGDVLDCGLGDLVQMKFDVCDEVVL